MPFIAKPCEQDVSKDALLQLLEQNIDPTEDPIVKESLMLLRQEIENPTYSKAIIKGLIENLRQDTAYHWIAYVSAKYFNI